VHIPQAVWGETVESGRVPAAELAAVDGVQRHLLDPTQVGVFVRRHGLKALQAGEVECLYLCGELGGAVLLTDDLAVRDAATRLGLTPVGSLGVVVRAYHRGLLSLPDAERRLADLYDVSSLLVTRAIVELAIERLRTSPGNPYH
jgi:predicted nucleic acid-binding protein